MILYHFTQLSFICPELAPCEIDVSNLTLEPRYADGLEGRGMPKVVWLTTDPDPGGPAKPNTNGGNYCFPRIKLVIPTADRRLRHWPKWRKRHVGAQLRSEMIAMFIKEGHDPAAIEQKQEAWWMYFGSIPGSRIKAIDMMYDTSPWWECGDEMSHLGQDGGSAAS